MLIILVKTHFFVEYIVFASVDDKSAVTALSVSVYLLRVLALSSSHDRGKHAYLCAVACAHHLVGDLVDRLLHYLLAAVGTMRNTYSRIQKSEIVIYLRHRTHRRTRVVRRGLLVYGNRRRQAVDIIYVGLVHLSQKLSCV